MCNLHPFHCNDNTTGADDKGAWLKLWPVPDATPEVVKPSYRAMAQLHHPDRGGDTATMQRINSAYEMIGGGR